MAMLMPDSAAMTAPATTPRSRPAAQMEGIEASNQMVVERIDQSEKDTDWNRDGEHGRERADMGLVLDEIGGDMKPAPVATMAVTISIWL